MGMIMCFEFEYFLALLIDVQFAYVLLDYREVISTSS